MSDALMAVSPIDGRYLRHTQDLRDYFSEYGLIKYRVWMEIEYLLALSQVDELKSKLSDVFKKQSDLKSLVQSFSEEDAQNIKDIEKVRRLRRALVNLKPVEGARRLVELLERYPTNAELLNQF